MERMKKLLSPGARKKPLTNSHRTFGVPLEDLVSRSQDRYYVPYIVSRICEHIQHKGFEHEGLFRVNGSTRIVEKLRMSFDQRGDADFEEEEDLMAVAGLLKLFLRELPGALIPETRTKQFISIQEVYINDPESCIHQLREEVRTLPEDNYNLLRYLVRFLVVVASYEKKNKMHPMALAIVFGPNVFKCGQGIVGLKDQGTVNQIVYKFITYYDRLFKEEGEESPQDQWIKKKQRAPPRPPPPKFHVEEYKPTPSPRLHKTKSEPYDSSHYQDHEEQDKSEESSSHTLGKGSIPSPMFSDDEMAGRASPFILDRAVEKVITQTISEALFGDDVSLQGSQDFMIDLPNGSGTKENFEDRVPVKDRIKNFEMGGEKTFEVDENRPFKQHSSSSFDLYKSNGGLVSQVYSRSDIEHMDIEREQDEFESVKRDSGTLSSFKRPSGPKNRRSPSRRSRSNSLEKEMGDGDEIKVNDRNDNHVLTSPDPSPSHQHDPPTKGEQLSQPPQPKPRIAFLELTNNQSENRSPDVSPNSGRKPFIPPLDFSTLHEHIDSTDPILAHKGQSVSYQRAKSHLNGDESADVLISPRNAKLIKRKSHGTAVEDEITLKMKQQHKKVHVLKKKLKHFEETFEKEQGYKPSHADKTGNATVKKWMNDLSKAKREIKRLKDEAEIGSRSRHGSGASSSGERMDPPDLPPTMGHTLDLILKRLGDKRRECHRPEDVDLMTRDQVQEEKLAVQKALLHFENIHGRPKLKEEKDLMRPLYDRYRKIKRIIAKPMSPREKNELQIIHEDQELNSVPNYSKPRVPVHVPTGEVDENGEDHGTQDMGTMDFIVTRDFSLYRDTAQPLPKENIQSGHSPKVKRKLELPGLEEEEENVETRNSTTEPNLHEMSLSELQDEFIRSKGEKKRLRRTLRTFEEDFFNKNGR
ncbi:hypothetical protein FSP39_011458 [Pinctada imbricata]|uniref:Rho-GAP domain-containing protein n=1 Tax=Pinctada imbricata TaxID=66713 RepID=A0AA88XXR1_PINIB|nr:hypothetical protein FSP39_011458 [Pinctada imbricata]